MLQVGAKGIDRQIHILIAIPVRCTDNMGHKDPITRPGVWSVGKLIQSKMM
jgi:hypothetical protein